MSSEDFQIDYFNEIVIDYVEDLSCSSLDDIDVVMFDGYDDYSIKIEEEEIEEFGIFDDSSNDTIIDELIIKEEEIEVVKKELYCNKEIVPNDIQEGFIEYIKSHEMKMFGKTYIDYEYTKWKHDYLYDITTMSKTDLWRKNGFYGVLFQAYICNKIKCPIPSVRKRNRKRPIKRKTNCMKKRGFDHDEIMYELERNMIHEVSTNDDKLPRVAPRNQVSLVEFLLDILNYSYFQNYISWTKRESGEFIIKNPRAIAYYWMIVKDNDTCNYENFARGIRYKRKSGLFKQLDRKKRRIYQFDKKILNKCNKKYKNLLLDYF